MSVTNDQSASKTAWPLKDVYAKDVLIFVPVLGSALAIIYDVGFFSGLNVDYFTVFSLSEHIVFALEVFPFALFGAFVLGFIIWIGRIGRHRTNRPSKGSIVGGILATIIIAAACLYFLSLTAAIFISLGIVTAMVFNETDNLMARLLLGCALAAVATFSFGYGLGYSVVHAGQNDHRDVFRSTNVKIITKDNEQIDARLIIRTGERGVLFLDAKTKQVTLLSWAEIVRISASP